MTNPATPGGGMPKWLIILLVVLVIMLLGCCGFFATCAIMAKHVAKTAAQQLQENAPKWQAEMERQAQAAQARTEAQERAGGTGNAGEAAPGGNAAPGGADNAADAAPAQKLPASFPSDIPIYSGLTPTAAYADNTKGNGTVMLTGNGDGAKVAEYYQKELEAKGWKQENNTSLNNMTLLTYSKGTDAVNLSITPDGSKVTVTIAYEKK